MPSFVDMGTLQEIEAAAGNSHPNLRPDCERAAERCRQIPEREAHSFLRILRHLERLRYVPIPAEVTEPIGSYYDFFEGSRANACVQGKFTDLTFFAGTSG
jgi:hypothetical protein